MKKVLSVILVLIAIFTCLTGCSVMPESIVLSSEKMTINTGNSQAVSCEILPENTSDKTVIWSSSDANVASVNNVGVITANNAGECTITAKCGELTATLSVVVEKPVEQLILNKYEISLFENETFSLTCTIIPDDATDKKIKWVSSDDSVAKVDEKGTVTALKTGKCTITATCNEKIATANITIEKKVEVTREIVSNQQTTKAKKKVDLKELYETYCNTNQFWSKLGPDASYLSIDTNPYNVDQGLGDNPFAIRAVKQINEAMNLPDYLNDEINSTNSLMGRREETFEDIGIKVIWSYHPDNGLEITYRYI